MKRSESGYRPVEGKTGKKNTVCFGAGKILHDFLNGYADYDLAAKIELVLDNNEEKWGTQVSVCGRNIDVTSVQNFCKSISGQ